MNEQDEFILAVNWWAMKNMKQTAKKTVLSVGGSTLDIPKDNLVLLRDHPEGIHKIQDNCKSELLIIVSKHKDPNVTFWIYVFIYTCILYICECYRYLL